MQTPLVNESPQGFVIVVSGLPRSGTSMIMRMLEAGGFQLLTDNVRKPDTDNPGGYYEFEPVKRLASEHGWVAGAVGRVVKVISPLLPSLPAAYQYRVVFLQRDMREVLASQRAMLVRRTQTDGSAGDHRMGLLFSKHLRRIESWLSQQPNMEALYVPYTGVLENPQAAAIRLTRFLGREADTTAMARVVDTSLYRQRV